MLRLSDDVGTTADRILEMVDLILAMEDNIGLAADQILLIQQSQNINVALPLKQPYSQHERPRLD